MNRFSDRSNSNTEHYRARTVAADRHGNTQIYQAFSPRGSHEHRQHIYQGNPMEHLDHISSRYHFDVARPQPLSADINRRIERMRNRVAPGGRGGAAARGGRGGLAARRGRGGSAVRGAAVVW